MIIWSNRTNNDNAKHFYWNDCIKNICMKNNVLSGTTIILISPNIIIVTICIIRNIGLNEILVQSKEIKRIETVSVCRFIIGITFAYMMYDQINILKMFVRYSQFAHI